MIIFLYGRDGYRLKQNLEKIVAEYKKKYSGLSYSVLDLNEADGLEKLENNIKTLSFFKEKRLVVIKNSFSEATRVGKFINDLGLAYDKQQILVFIEDASQAQLNKKDKKFLTVLTSKPNIVKSLEPIDGSKLENWLVKEIRTAGYEIEKEALQNLIDSTINPAQKETGQSATWQLGQEIEKILSYKSAQSSKLITQNDVETLVTPRIDLNIFQVVDAIASKNQRRAITLFHNHIENGADPYYIFSMILYQFRNLLRIKSLIKNAVPYPNIIQKTGLNPFVVKKTYEQCKKYELDELKYLFNILAQIDIAAKNGKIDMADVLYQLLFNLDQNNTKINLGI